MKQNVSTHRKYGMIVMIWEHVFLAAIFFCSWLNGQNREVWSNAGQLSKPLDFGVMTHWWTLAAQAKEAFEDSHVAQLCEKFGVLAQDGLGAPKKSTSGIAFTVNFHQKIRFFSPWEPRNFAWKCQIPISLNEKLSKQPLTSQHFEPPQK